MINYHISFGYNGIAWTLLQYVHAKYMSTMLVCVCVIFDIWIKLWQTIIFQFCLFFCFGYIYDSYCCYCVVRSIRSDSCFDFSFFSLAFTIWIDIGFDFFFYSFRSCLFPCIVDLEKEWKKKSNKGKKLFLWWCYRSNVTKLSFNEMKTHTHIYNNTKWQCVCVCVLKKIVPGRPAWRPFSCQ